MQSIEAVSGARFDILSMAIYFSNYPNHEFGNPVMSGGNKRSHILKQTCSFQLFKYV